MLSLEKLAALDLSIWLRSGEEAGRHLGITQPNVSRQVKQALGCFGLQLTRGEWDWELVGDAPDLELLAMERRVHQLARWRGKAPLRLEGTYWSGPLLLTPTPPGWIGGRHDNVGIARPLQWLRHGVIDAWLAGGPDWPEPEDPELAVVHLCRMPIHLVVAPSHPLLRQLERMGALRFEDVAAFPSLALPAGAYPRVEASLRRLGLWNTPSRMRFYRRNLWEGLSETELVVGYATVLSEQVAGALVRLPLTLPVESGEALVLRREWVGDSRTTALVSLLKQRLEPWAADHPELKISC